MPKSVLIAGGGIVGTAAALRLQQAGCQVRLVDPGDDRRGASFGNIGHIACEQVEPLASWPTLFSFPRRLFAFGGPLDFRLPDAAAWVPWSLKFLNACRASKFADGVSALSALQAQALPAWQRLAELSGHAEIVKANGHCVVWLTEQAATTGMTAWRRARTGTTSFRELQADELDLYRSAMRRAPVAGLRFSGSGQFDEPQNVRRRLREKFKSLGGVDIVGEVLGVEMAEAHVSFKLSSGETLRGDEAVVACGAWSDALMKSFGLNVPLIAERGYSVQSAAHHWPSELPPTVIEERSMVISRFSSGLRASSFLELSRPSSPPDARKWNWLERQLDDLGVSFDRQTDRWTGPRPSLPDFLPAIGRLAKAPRVLYAFGHQHLGMTLSAVTAELLEAMVCGFEPAIDMRPFAIERFA